MSVRFIIRGYGDGVKIFEERKEMADDADADIAQLAHDHLAVLMQYELHMVEFEFPDMPKDERFFRFGTDSRMVIPIGVKL